MKIKLVASVAAALTLLGACANLGIGTRRFSCSGICTVEVRVISSTGSPCRIEFVDTMQLDLDMPRGTADVPIRWALDNASAARYEFKDGAFQLKSGSTNQFQQPGPIGNGKKFQITNRNDDGRSYEYKLTVHSKVGTDTCLIDPFIHNNN